LVDYSFYEGDPILGEVAPISSCNFILTTGHPQAWLFTQTPFSLYFPLILGLSREAIFEKKADHAFSTLVPTIPLGFSGCRLLPLAISSFFL